MTVRQQWGVVGAVVLLLAAALVVGLRVFGDELHPVTVGAEAPGFTAKDLASGKMRTLADYRGKVVLLNVWATWCPPCLDEMPSIERLHEAYAKEGLAVVAVSIDDYVSEDSIRAFTRGLGLTFDILHDPAHAIERTYQTTGYPESFVIDRKGVIRKKWISAADWTSPANRALVEELLGGGAVAAR